MKRDWGIIRAVLITIEEDRFDDYMEESENDSLIIGNTTFLIQAGFLNGKAL